MTDEELIERLRDLGLSFPNWQDGFDAADRIEELLRKNDNLFDLAQQEHSRAERLAELLDRAVNGPWLDGDLELARAALTQKDRTDAE